ncbi:patatin-like phospholipase family protein [Undibacterium sp. TS12]|uniref:patatin-like phospholipase family protein n=1 Tax=Undibacterium sp. TS12 TaxID=2908202 RepID=UPI001F4D34F7|nr:patatin-like phospholipase family protein [Undibacterium sp. TS12]MCH8622810.1 patatin-like phospholipase family protein [Undibacterium sp. TS12]
MTSDNASTDDKQGSGENAQDAVYFATVQSSEQTSLGLDESTFFLGKKPQSVGLALSGGGIRSATFNLGILQALASKGKLASFDYLSTVSGGGYIGSWLTAWIHRSSLANVQAELTKVGSSHEKSLSNQEPPQVNWLRRYSNYLTPQVGLLSADSLTMISIWLRNVTLNLIIILAFFSFLFLLPKLMMPVVEALVKDYRPALGIAAAWGGIFFMPTVMMLNFQYAENTSGEKKSWFTTTNGVALTVLLPATFAGLAGSIWLFGTAGSPPETRLFICLLATFFLLMWAIWLLIVIYKFFPKCPSWKEIRQYVFEAFIFVMAGGISLAVAAGVLAYAKDLFIFADDTHLYAALITFGPTAFLVTFGFTGSIFVGLVGRVYFERTREWWSRMNAWLITIGLVWFVLTSCSFYVAALAEWLVLEIGIWGKTALSAGWLASLYGVFFSPKKEPGSESDRMRVKLLSSVAGVIFSVGLVIAIAFLTELALTKSAGIEKSHVPTSHGTSKINVDLSGQHITINSQIKANEEKNTSPTVFVNAHFDELKQLLELKLGPTNYLPIAALFSLLVLLLFGWRVDVNKFSLHNMYKNRLIRCYLGASNPSRHAHPFTGLDDKDDIALTAMIKKEGDQQKEVIQRPIHIINTTLNLTQGDNMAWQERKAASFFLTPAYCGYELGKTQGETTHPSNSTSQPHPGFRTTNGYAKADLEEHGFSLGMAMATSGAAASPNMGKASSPVLAFVMTLLNIRLGRWSPNPAKNKWKHPGPRFGLFSLLQELFGYSNEESSFVCLSDGGHFDNTGIYELVRRRCAVIWIVDAAADPDRGFEVLAKAIRQCRIDFGVEISLNLTTLRGTDKNLPETAFCKGDIIYGGGWENGQIIYIKPTVCHQQTEPVDILDYKQRNPSFPQETTVDQFFGESQFESYRRLGLHIGTNCISAFGNTLPDVALKAYTEENKTDKAAQNSTTKFSWTSFWREIKSKIKSQIKIKTKTENSSWTWFWRFASATLALMLSLALFKSWALPELPFKGGDTSTCITLLYAKTLQPVCDGPTPSQVMEPQEKNAKTFVLAYLIADNLFIIAYTGLFISGFLLIRNILIADQSQLRAWFTPVMCLVPLAGAAIDYAENFILMIAVDNPVEKISYHIMLAHPFAALKFQVAGVNAAILLSLGLITWIMVYREKKK